MPNPSSAFYILDPERLEPASSAPKWLGRIVKNYADPIADFTPDDPSLLITEPHHEVTISNATSFLSSSSSASVSGRLKDVASLVKTSAMSRGLDFSATSIKSIRMESHRMKFLKLCQDKNVREALGRMLPVGGRPAYMIVGLLIWTDTKFTESKISSQENETSLEVPVDLIAAVAAGAPLPAPLPSPGISVSGGRSTERKFTGVVEGSYIFGVEYRTVRRRKYAIFRNFTPTLDEHGPRVRGGNVFNGDGTDDDGKGAEEVNAEEFEADEEEWTDMISDEDELEVEEGVQGIDLAV